MIKKSNKGSLALVTFFLRSAIIVITTTYPLIAVEEIHVSTTLVGLLATINGIATAILSFFVASKVKDEHLFFSLGVGAISLSISGFVYALAPVTFAYVVAAILSGFAASLIFPSIINLFSLTSKGRPDRSLTAYSVTLGVSLLLGPFWEYLLLKIFHMPLYLAVAIFSVPPVASIPFIRVFKSRNTISKSHHGQTALRGLTSVDRLIFMTAVSFQLVYMIPFVITTSFLGVFLRLKLHLSNPDILGFTTFYFFVSLFGRIFLFWVSHKVNWLRVGVFACGVSLLGLLFLSFSKMLLVVTLAVILLGLSHGLLYPTSITLLSGGVSKNQVTRLNGHMNAISAIANIVVPVTAGAMISNLGFNTTFLVLNGPLALLTVVAFIFYRRCENLVPKSVYSAKG